jgi:tetratricopeptide (TPR) repeat protein
MSRALVLVLAATVAVTAIPEVTVEAAPPRAASRTTKADGRRYRAALKAGRAKVKAKDFKGAVAELEAALVAVPDDARALSELGWAAFKAGDLVKARKATDRSIAAAGDPELRAASFYNLGRILEAESKKVEAIDAYRRSLVLRPNATVRDRLVGLDPEARPDEPIAPQPLAGPFPSMNAYCEKLAKQPEPEPCKPAAENGIELPKVAFEAPFKELAIMLTDDERCSLGIRTPAGWFVNEDFAECRFMGGRWDRLVTFASVQKRDVVAGEPKELVFSIEVEESYNDTADDAGEDELEITNTSYSLLMVCGAGASGKPSCTPATMTSWKRDDEPGLVLEPRFEEGALILRLASGGGKTGGAQIGAIGKHPLRFP